jgi:glycosyltransferase involved in cell wall biosynthesis
MDVQSSPRVSIVMSVFNGERFLREAVDSLLGQTFREFELVVVDDGSNDGTAAILRSYKDRRIRTTRSPVNVGQPAGLNRGLASSAGTYVARLDADDVALPERLARQVAFLDARPDTAALGSAWIEIDENGRRGPVRLPPTDSIGIRWRLLFSNSFLHSSMLVRRSALEEVGAYDESIGYGEDYELWSRVAARFEVANLPDPLVLYRQGPASKTSTIGSAQAQVDAIAAANIDRVAGSEHPWSVSSSAELASAARRLLLSGDVDLDPAAATRLARDLLELQGCFAGFFRLPSRTAAHHRVRVSSVLASRLRSIGRAQRDARTWRSGLRLLVGAASRDPGILIRRHDRP